MIRDFIIRVYRLILEFIYQSICLSLIFSTFFHIDCYLHNVSSVLCYYIHNNERLLFLLKIFSKFETLLDFLDYDYH